MVVPVFWRTQKQRYSLQAEVCRHCSSNVFPSRIVCPYCRQSMAARPAAPAVREITFARHAAQFALGATALSAAAPAAAGDD